MWFRFRELQDKVNSLNDSKEFCDLETASSSGLGHVHIQPISVPSARGLISRDSWLQPDTRNSLSSSGNFFGGLLARGEPSSALIENSKNFGIVFLRIEAKKAEQGEGVRQEPQGSTIPTPRFVGNPTTWNPLYRTGGTCSQKCMMENPRHPVSENSQTQWAFSAGRSTARPKYALPHYVPQSQCCEPKK